jgi:hypothetical protein
MPRLEQPAGAVALLRARGGDPGWLGQYAADEIAVHAGHQGYAYI